MQENIERNDTLGSIGNLAALSEGELAIAFSGRITGLSALNTANVPSYVVTSKFSLLDRLWSRSCDMHTFIHGGVAYDLDLG